TKGERKRNTTFRNKLVSPFVSNSQQTVTQLNQCSCTFCCIGCPICFVKTTSCCFQCKVCICCVCGSNFSCNFFGCRVNYIVSFSTYRFCEFTVNEQQFLRIQF